MSLGFALVALAASACDLENEGAAPPEGKLNFPTALSLSPAIPGNGMDDAGVGSAAMSEHLFVVNSNFDLRYNKGSLQAYSLRGIKEQVDLCTPRVSEPPAGCEYDNEGILRIEPMDVHEGEALIDSFGTGIALSSESDPGADHRVFVPIRSQGHLSYTDYQPGTGTDSVLFCGTTGGRKCTVSHQIDDSSVVNDRDIEVPGEPVAVIAGPLTQWDAGADPGANYVLVTHQRGEVSLYVDTEAGEMVLTDTLGTFPSGLTGVMFDPQSQLGYMTGAGKQLTRVGVATETGPGDASLFDGGSLGLDGIGLRGDTRAGVIVPGEGGAPSQALVVTQAPDALLYVDLGPESRTQLAANVKRVVEVGGGASRLVVGTLLGEDGQSREIVAVSCFNGRQIFIIDRDSGTILSVVPNFSGPFEIALDGPRGLLYVADFRSSVVRIVDLRPVLAIEAGLRDEPTSAVMVATLGSPRVLQELQ